MQWLYFCLFAYGGKEANDEFFIQSKMDYHGVIRNRVGNDFWRIVCRRHGICQSHVSGSQLNSAFGSDRECGKVISDWQERHWHHTFNMFGYNNIAIVGYIYLGLELYCQGINNRI